MDQDLDELQQIVKRLDTLLADRQAGLFSWLTSWLTFLTGDMEDMRTLLNRIMGEK
jgi:hypothetical protein